MAQAINRPSGSDSPVNLQLWRRLQEALVIGLGGVGLFILVALTIVVNQIRVDVMGAVMGLGIVATGFPAYYLWAKNHEPA